MIKLKLLAPSYHAHKLTDMSWLLCNRSGAPWHQKSLVTKAGNAPWARPSHSTEISVQLLRPTGECRGEPSSAGVFKGSSPWIRTQLQMAFNLLQICASLKLKKRKEKKQNISSLYVTICLFRFLLSDSLLALGYGAVIWKMVQNETVPVWHTIQMYWKHIYKDTKVKCFSLWFQQMCKTVKVNSITKSQLAFVVEFFTAHNRLFILIRLVIVLNIICGHLKTQISEFIRFTWVNHEAALSGHVLCFSVSVKHWHKEQWHYERSRPVNDTKTR